MLGDFLFALFVCDPGLMRISDVTWWTAASDESLIGKRYRHREE
jgi:hypothetical protein